jgi:hypothetical protein
MNSVNLGEEGKLSARSSRDIDDKLVRLHRQHVFKELLK